MPRFRRLKRIFKFAVGVLTLFIVLTVIGLVYLARTRVPDLERTVIYPSIKSEVTVVRDDWGVPHIEAANETDAYFALGYCMAQDRLFQMEILSMVVQLFGSWPQTAVSMRNEGNYILGASNQLDGGLAFKNIPHRYRLDDLPRSLKERPDLRHGVLGIIE